MDQDKKNKYFFGLGTVGRDMFYAFEANAMIYFLSNILQLPLTTFAMVSLVLTVLRVFDALNDPITGLIIDNIKSPWGKYKPPISPHTSLSRRFSSRIFPFQVRMALDPRWAPMVVLGVLAGSPR